MAPPRSSDWVPLRDWPELDQLLWSQARGQKGCWLDESHAPQWAPASWRHVASAYCRWLGFLAAIGRLDPVRPELRVTRDLVALYVAHLEATLRPSTAWNYVKGLRDAMRVFAPSENFDWLAQVRDLLKTKMRPNPAKRARVQDSKVLMHLGIDLMEQQASPTVDHPLRPAIDFRDGLLIFMLAARPLRLRNLTNIVIGRNLVCQDGIWHLTFSGDETKTGRPTDLPLPSELGPYLERYLSEFRPRFPGTDRHHYLWGSCKGGRLTEGAIYVAVTDRTKAALGVAVSPHLFRDSAATSFAIRDPKHVRAAMAILGHANFAMTDRHYIQATSVSAARHFQENIAAMRLRYPAKVGK